MKKEILIFTVLISNIAFASVFPLEIGEVRVVLEIRENKNRTNTLHDASIKRLQERGLDKIAANRKVLETLSGDEYANDLMAQNIIENFSEIKREDVVSYISDSALHAKRVDLGSYANIINLFQKNNIFALDNETLKKIEKISFENKNIRSKFSEKT